jgi:hypothetical protein
MYHMRPTGDGAEHLRPVLIDTTVGVAGEQRAPIQLGRNDVTFELMGSPQIEFISRLHVELLFARSAAEGVPVIQMKNSARAYENVHFNGRGCTKGYAITIPLFNTAKLSQLHLGSVLFMCRFYPRTFHLYDTVNLYRSIKRAHIDLGSVSLINSHCIPFTFYINVHDRFAIAAHLLRNRCAITAHSL